MKKEEHNIRNLYDAEESQETKSGGLFLGILFFLIGGYGIYSNLRGNGILSILALFLVISGLLMIIFFGRGFIKGRREIKDIENSIPSKRLNLQRNLDLYSTLILIFGVIALICLFLCLIVVGFAQQEGEKLFEILFQKKGTLLVLSGLSLLSSSLAWFSYRKLDKIKKEYLSKSSED